MPKREPEETSAFTSNGHEAFPPSYEDNKRVSEFSTWPTLLLRGKLLQYIVFLERDDIMPRARTTASRIIEHLDFELQWRVAHPDWDAESVTVGDGTEDSSVR